MRALIMMADKGDDGTVARDPHSTSGKRMKQN
jgi:hypothetical protein